MSTGSAESKIEEIAQTNFWALKNPPKAHYNIECSIELSKGSIEGIERIRFKNSASRPISRLKIHWISLGNMEIKSNGIAAKILSETKEGIDLSVLIELANPVYPGGEANLEISFAVKAAAYLGKEEVKLPFWHPRLDWGFEAHNDYDVKIDKTSEYVLVTSGTLASKSGYYHAENVRRFGLFFGKGHKVIEANAKDVLVQVVYKAEAEECARLVLETAVDAINFYRGRFGFYPYQSLVIVPGGMGHPAGGYPIATSIVGIHAMEQFDSMPKLHWQWITAHEIGHQYWGEHVLSKDPTDSLDWLMIGLGIYADREYIRARDLGLGKHKAIMNRYIKGVRGGLDTTIARTPEERAEIKFDFNNVVEHGKSYSVISALDCILGKKVFDSIYRRCLKDFGGKRLGVHDFRAVCEEETGQDLGWFFDQWVNSNKYLSYEISSQKCDKKGEHYTSKVEVTCLGDLKMPVPIAAYFEDGTYQTQFTDRLKDINILEFKSSSPLKEVRLDPERALAFASVVPPAPIRPAEFEIVDVEFEPIHQGKNVVWVKVRNTSPEAQTFDINVYSRSPEYGEGMGWGRNFYDSIKGGETKRMCFAFKIFGPITDSTFICLTFYNPGPAADFDEEKWRQQRKSAISFKKIKYNSSDLEKLIKVDTKQLTPASESQIADVIRVFRQIQAYVRDENYKTTWQLFTKDYQNIEFRNEFDRFRKVMDSESMLSVFLWNRAEFLALQPESVTKKKELFTLTASSQSEFWTIDFVSVNGKWKIDWIGGYTPAFVKGHWANWKERLLPQMQKLSTKHFDIYYYKDSSAEKEIEQIAKRKEKGFEEICQFLGQDYDVRICMAFFEDGATKKIETSHQGTGWAYGNTIVEVYNEKQKMDPYHETVHILMGPYGNPPALFNEGFAVYMSERLGACALEALGGGQTTIYTRTSELKRKNEWIDLEELLTYTSIGPAESRPSISYPEAAAFVKFLIEEYGKAKFIDAYKTLKNSEDQTVQQQNIETLKRTYGKSLSELEKQWESAFIKDN